MWHDAGDSQRLGIVSIALPWLAAAMAGAIVPLGLLGIYELSPALREGLHEALSFAWPWCDDSLTALPLAWVWASNLVYWGLGLVLAVRAFEWRAPVLHRVAAMLLNITVGLLFFTVPLLATIWALAIADGWGAYLAQWVGWTGNHGPWRHACQLRNLIMLTFLVPGLACWTGVFAFAIRPSLAALVAFLASGAGFWGLFSTHYWLID